MAAIDCEFVDLIDQITRGFDCLKSIQARYIVEQWITRLSTEIDKVLRNDYTRQLGRFVECRELRYPFDQPPPCGRLPLYNDIVNPNLNPFAVSTKNYFDDWQDCAGDENFYEEEEDISYATFSRDKLNPPDCCIPKYIDCDDEYEKYEQGYPDGRALVCPPCPPPCEPVDICQNEGYMPKREITQPLGNYYLSSKCKNNEELIDKLIDAICPNTLLEEFASQVARFTCDNGKIMFSIISQETNHFRDLVRNIYENRTKDVSETLNEEQKRVKDTYERWESRVLARTGAEMQAIYNTISDFDWKQLENNPDYLWNKIYPKINKEYRNCSKSSNVNLKVNQQRKTWLNGVARDIQEDNADRRAELTQLSKLLSSLTISYACSQNKLTEHVAMMECEANSLKTKIIENQKLIETLITKIEQAYVSKC